jgi:POT family proton-dependent oligopeptide transporter
MSAADPTKEELFGHPKGLYVLFFTELWERFSYYGMRALLALYMAEQAIAGPHGGLGWSKEEALGIYGTYTMSVYLASIPGGIIADKWLGQRKAVMVGGLLLCAGHLTLALPGIAAFYGGLALIVAGVGLLKPNISTMVGGLYEAGDPRRDLGFNIFYMGINIGAFASGFAVGAVRIAYGWHYGFALAGIGMLFGQAVYMWGQKYIRHVGNLSTASENAEEREAMKRSLDKKERDRMLVMLLSFLIVIVFWGAFEQAGGLMNLYTQEKTDRFLMGWEVPTEWFQSLNPAYIILLAVPIGSFWVMWSKAGRQSSSLFKMALGTMIMGWGFIFMVFAADQTDAGDKAWMGWLVLAYLFHTIGELCASPVALSFITKLAPLKYASLMMGAYFAATGLGNKVAGLVGEAAVGEAGERAIFIGIAAFCTIFGAIVIVLLKPLQRLTHGAEDAGHGAGEDEQRASGGPTTSTAA